MQEENWGMDKQERWNYSFPHKGGKPEVVCQWTSVLGKTIYPLAQGDYTEARFSQIYNLAVTFIWVWDVNLHYLHGVPTLTDPHEQKQHKNSTRLITSGWLECKNNSRRIESLSEILRESSIHNLK